MSTEPAPPPPPPNPHLVAPVLWLSGVPATTTDADIAELLKSCCKLRILREQGKIEFESLDRTEKAYATCNGQRLPGTSASTLVLSLASPSSAESDPLPLAAPRIIKQLPPSFTASKLFDLARPFGPLHSATLLYSPSPHPGEPPRFKGHALVTFYDEQHAVDAERGLHFLEVEGQNIAVQVYEPKRAARASAGGRTSGAHTPARASLGGGVSASGGSPSASRWASPAAAAPASTPSRSCPVGLGLGSAAAGAVSPTGMASRPMSRNVSSSSTASRWSNEGGGAAPVAVSIKPRRSTADVVDPCNLFVKSLHPSLSTADLTSLFSPFGTITSARVQTNPASPHRSKEFGFVSFADEDMARRAMVAMDGTEVAGRRITVCVFEPKGVRAQRLSAGGAAGGVDEGVDEVRRGMDSLTTTPSRSPRPTASSTTSSTTTGTPSRSPIGPPAHDLAPVTDAAASSPSLPSVAATEQERLEAGVAQLVVDESKRVEVLKLFEGLSKKERKLCLFSEETLRAKVEAALDVLEADDEPASPRDAVAPGEPDVDLPSSLVELAALPATSILALLASFRLSSPFPLPAPPPSDADLVDTLAFVDSLYAQGLEPAQVKQKLGERLFKVVKALASERKIKGAPRITIDLLDSEDLRALASLMHWPAVLGEKVALVAAAK
ncbi:hypothetical protein JCM8208_000123 [Rhodotorula glutinis]